MQLMQNIQDPSIVSFIQIAGGVIDHNKFRVIIEGPGRYRLVAASRWEASGVDIWLDLLTSPDSEWPEFPFHLSNYGNIG